MMGYTTDFTGAIAVLPPLNAAEIAYLTRFAESRRMARANGGYYLGGDDAVIDHNRPAGGQPGLWCQWIPIEDGTALVWDDGEKFYNAEEWMRYLIDHFLKPDGEARGAGLSFMNFTFDHVLNGCIEAQGADADDLWRLVVTDNVVTRVDAQPIWPDGTPDVTS